MTGPFTRMAVAAVLVTAGATAAQAQDFSYGESLFRNHCAVCHGESAAGNGPVAELFAVKPRNLRMLAKENGGAFPFSEVYQSIDGTRDITAHGRTEMPIWGALFREEAYPKTVHPGVTAKEFVQGRILGLVYYLQSIQEG